MTNRHCQRSSRPSSGSTGGAVASVKGTAQLRGVVERLIAVGQWQTGDPGITIVMDIGYDVIRLAWVLRDLPVELVGRIRSPRLQVLARTGATRWTPRCATCTPSATRRTTRGTTSAAVYIPPLRTFRREGSMSARPMSVTSCSLSGPGGHPASLHVTGRPSSRDSASVTAGRASGRGTDPAVRCDTANVAGSGTTWDTTSSGRS
ncbi:transposase [Streptomyces sp. MMS24-I29]|uniref:transposase n=1 Tax=unclassified Streptomyces TaxID=2593676 RepID=UPI0026D711B5